MTFTTNKELIRQNIAKLTEEYLAEGNEIKKLKSSKTQESYVRNTHHSKSGRIGWFEMK